MGGCCRTLLTSGGGGGVGAWQGIVRIKSNDKIQIKMAAERRHKTKIK